jgi:hypothetical protein
MAPMLDEDLDRLTKQHAGGGGVNQALIQSKRRIERNVGRKAILAVGGTFYGFEALRVALATSASGAVDYA